MKTEVDKLNTNKCVILPTGFNNLKTEVDNWDADKLKTVQLLSDVTSKKVVKNTKSNKLNTKVNNLKNKTTGSSTLI